MAVHKIKRPLIQAVIRRRVMRELVKNHGYSPAEAESLVASELTDDLIQTGIEQTEGAVGAIGDGTILKLIIDFIQSPAGQQLIQILIALLTGGI